MCTKLANSQVHKKSIEDANEARENSERSDTGSVVAPVGERERQRNVEFASAKALAAVVLFLIPILSIICP